MKPLAILLAWCLAGLIILLTSVGFAWNGLYDAAFYFLLASVLCCFIGVTVGLKKMDAEEKEKLKKLGDEL